MSSLWKKTLFATLISGLSYTANANILTSIQPLGFIASAIADGVTTTEVLIPATASPHDYSLKPSDVKKLQNAGLVVWIGEDIDGFLEKAVKKLPTNKVITLEDVKQIEPLLGQAADDHEHGHHDDDHHHKDQHDDDHHEHEHEHEHHHDKHDNKHENAHHHDDEDDLETNWHIWLSPEISKIIASEIAEKLIKQYPAKKGLIESNLAEFNADLKAKSAKITTQLKPVANQGFYVFHDAYRYFEDAYGLKQTGYFTVNPLVAPGAKTIAEIKQKLAENKVKCLFTEPQFTPKVVETLSKNTGAKIGQLDPLGSTIPLGKKAYTQFLQQLADNFESCLK
ncbi:zinc ABC transporter substrate-binding protein [Mergibacter septicus]|uniref:High-affinity zinc uptake system protein ZnuA n=1 Tax=Mergibacter septicus TaxID=221402 RepID=A0A8D4IXX3_9PAST|nr:zinc ABC transporter substrate-binding protein ZnuA [Mergibacter septicus]AWX15459.1 zinc ABC transporter substrate-binding protein [Mergibacter septicus]QDJ14712.1 zinc ABC transporter substrate-binding protein [Mergibacter septicus]UTU47860.1 zinc ABC transporter substrate-binding protein ZnuA [Mergibacter septicus]